MDGKAFDHACNLAHFLRDRTGSVYGKWCGSMPAKEQRALFGRFLGKGRLVIDGAAESIKHSRKVCFGTDFEVNHNVAWRELY